MSRLFIVFHTKVLEILKLMGCLKQACQQKTKQTRNKGGEKVCCAIAYPIKSAQRFFIFLNSDLAGSAIETHVFCLDEISDQAIGQIP
jgi:hypothetical protein